MKYIKYLILSLFLVGCVKVDAGEAIEYSAKYADGFQHEYKSIICMDGEPDSNVTYCVLNPRYEYQKHLFLICDYNGKCKIKDSILKSFEEVDKL